ncbi:MAG: glycosyltransferase family 4 protein [Chloroflexi bacterium]|nr:glycosyltransferase family 4 protein [Chloroflexota bacterium]
MKVALVTPYPVDVMRIPGGVRTVAYNLVQGLRHFDDLDIHVFHCHSEVPANRVESEGNLTVHYMTMPRRRVVPNTILAVKRVTQALRQLQPDVVNAHAPHYAVAAFQSGYPTVYTVHGVTHREASIYRNNPFDRLRFAVESYYAKRALQEARHIIAISPYVMHEYEGWTEAHWHRIDNPLPDDFFAIARREVPGRVLFVGSITEVKDILTLLQAVVLLRERCPGTSLSVHLAGRTTSRSYERVLRAFVQEKGLEDIVTFLGLLDRERLFSEYGECALVALPSLQENAPMAIIEAMAAGVPVVATEVGGIADLVEDGVTGFLFPARDAMTMAERMLCLLENRDLCWRMGCEAKARARGRFGLMEVAHKYRQVYEIVAGVKSL